jgi:hypothetical protein
MRPTALLVFALTGSLLFAGYAVASTVGIDGDTLRFDAGPGEFNEVDIMLQSGQFTVQDGTGGPNTLSVTARPPCQAGFKDLIGAYCPAEGVNRIAVTLGDENDSVSIGAMAATDYPTTIDGGGGADQIWAGPQADDVHGGPGNDTITGNRGRDVLSGDAGDDTIDAADGLPDQIACGPGIDNVTADLVDVAADDCELVNIGPGQPQQVTIRDPASSPLAALRARGLRTHLTCPAACAARAELLLPAVAGASSTNASVSSTSRLVASGRARRGGAGGLTVVTSLRPGAVRRLRHLRPRRLTLRATVTIRSTTTVLQRFIRVGT